MSEDSEIPLEVTLCAPWLGYADLRINEVNLPCPEGTRDAEQLGAREAAGMRDILRAAQRGARRPSGERFPALLAALPEAMLEEMAQAAKESGPEDSPRELIILTTMARTLVYGNPPDWRIEVRLDDLAEGTDRIAACCVMEAMRRARGGIEIPPDPWSKDAGFRIAAPGARN